MVMNKKGIAWMLRLVLALAFFALFAHVSCKYLPNLKSSEIEMFDEFVGTIRFAAENDLGQAATGFRFDKGSCLVGFKGREKYAFISIRSGESISDHKMLRPNICGIKSPCLCYCKKYALQEGSGIVVCENPVCNSHIPKDFPDPSKAIAKDVQGTYKIYICIKGDTLELKENKCS